MRRRLCLFLYIIAWSLCDITVANDNQYNLIISKKEQALRVMQGERLVRQFKISYGKGGKGTKSTVGDNKTPLGIYKITKVKASGRFHYFMQLDYPNLFDTWYGYKNGIINATEFKRINTAIQNNKIPPQDTKLGGYIGLHGLGNTTEKRLTVHNETNWTEGCIAMTNNEIDKLKQYARVGTKVIIKE